MATGLSGGLLSGLFGIGGGIILLPLLKLLLGLGQHQAQGITLAAMLVPGSIPALMHYHQRGIPIPWKLVGWLILGFLPGVWAGAVIAGLIPGCQLRWGFSGFLILLAIWTAARPVKGEDAKPAAPLGCTQLLWKGVLVGMVGGLLSGLLGIGGGVIMIPLLALWLRLPQHQAQLVSLAVLVLPIRLPGVLVYAQESGVFPWFILFGLASGFAFGTYFGARFATALSGRRLRNSFAGLMLVTAGMMIWKG